MYRDTIVEEVRRHREARAAKFGFDVRKIGEDARPPAAILSWTFQSRSAEAAGERLRAN